MSLTIILILALVQGLTEFLPVSSAAHLILAGQLLGVNQGLAFDVAAHVGTLIAVCVYFRGEVLALARAGLGGGQTRDRRLLGHVILATVPCALAGWIFVDFISTNLRATWIIAATTIGFGLLLGVADRFHGAERDEYDLSWRGALIIGLAQALALIPGTSRSGITMTAALFLGLSRTASARFSFLLAVPIMVLAGGYEALQVAQHDTAIQWREFGLAALFSFLAALACLHVFLKLIERVGMMPFVVYRLALGVVLLWAFTL